MNKQEVYEFLKNKNIWYEITEHEAVYSMSEVPNVEIPYPESEAKNLFVRDDKHNNYYLITVKGNKKVDLKKFRHTNNTRPLSFASSEELNEILKLIPGSVSPFGLLSDKENKVKFYIDKAFYNNRGIIGIHPNENTATVWLKIGDLVQIIQESGHMVYKIDIE